MRPGAPFQTRWVEASVVSQSCRLQSLSRPRIKNSGNRADAKTRIIRAAVDLFSERGIEEVSLRELTAKANVNIAAVNYHFGSRSGLVEAVFEDVSEQVNRRRLKVLHAILGPAAAAGVAPSLEAIVDAFIEPYLDESSSDMGALLARLILKHRQAPTEMTRRLTRVHFDPMAEQFIGALALAIADVELDELVWRYMFMTSAVVLAVTDRRRGNRVSALSAGRLDAADARQLRAALVRFLVGGLTAPVARPPAQS